MTRQLPTVSFAILLAACTTPEIRPRAATTVTMPRAGTAALAPSSAVAGTTDDAGTDDAVVHDFADAHRRVLVGGSVKGVPPCLRVSGCSDPESALSPVRVRVVDSDTQKTLLDVVWQTEVREMGFAVDPSGRWFALREGLDILVADLSTGDVGTMRSPHDGLDYGHDNALAFADAGGYLCSLQQGYYHVVVGPKLAEDRGVLCFARPATEEGSARDDDTARTHVDLVEVSLRAGARFAAAGDATWSRVGTWTRDAKTVAFFELAGRELFLVVTSPGAPSPRFRKKVHAFATADASLGQASIELLDDHVSVAGSETVMPDGPKRDFAASFDLTSGKRRP